MPCKTCGIDAGPDAFYKSNKSRCKACVRASVIANRNEKIEYYRSFDRLRGGLPHRVAARKEYAKTDAFKKSHLAANMRYIVANPDRSKARNAVSNAVRDGKLFKQPCFMCGALAEAHHPDYSRPLDVVWLCDHHHKQAHAMVRQYKEAA